MSLGTAVCALCLWAGAALLFGRIGWFRQLSLVERLGSHVPGARRKRSGSTAGLSVRSFKDVFAPLASDVGEKVAQLFGVADGLAVRLRRIGSPLNPSTFRVRQVGHAALSCGAALVVQLLAGLPWAIGLLVVAGAPLLTFLVVEQRLLTASQRHQRRLFDELPVIAEQIGMLLGAGYSLGSALNRIAQRSNGLSARHLVVVTNRIRQGLDEAEALAEWAQLVELPELHRLVSVLALNREAGDLGRLIGEEARSMRREAQRRAMSEVERRDQLVWIPVTVATLVPGVMLMAIPFISALDAWTGL